MSNKQKEIDDLKNEIKYLNSLLTLSLDSARIALETNSKLVDELKKRSDEINQD